MATGQSSHPAHPASVYPHIKPAILVTLTPTIYPIIYSTNNSDKNRTEWKSILSALFAFFDLRRLQCHLGIKRKKVFWKYVNSPNH